MRSMRNKLYTAVHIDFCRLWRYNWVLTYHWSQFLGVPGVQPARLAEGLEPAHCALSLVGEPIMYPEINRFVELLHSKRISSFLVTNAQFPDAIRYYKIQCLWWSKVCTLILLIFSSVRISYSFYNTRYLLNKINYRITVDKTILVLFFYMYAFSTDQSFLLKI